MAKPRHERAVQFAPFSALTGFEEVIRSRAVRKAPRRELLPDEAERINRALTSISVGDTVRATYYRDGAYVTAVGILTDLDPIFATVTVVKSTIALSDLFAIEAV